MNYKADNSGVVIIYVVIDCCSVKTVTDKVFVVVSVCVYVLVRVCVCGRECKRERERKHSFLGLIFHHLVQLFLIT